MLPHLWSKLPNAWLALAKWRPLKHLENPLSGAPKCTKNRLPPTCIFMFLCASCTDCCTLVTSAITAKISPWLGGDAMLDASPTCSDLGAMPSSQEFQGFPVFSTRAGHQEVHYVGHSAISTIWLQKWKPKHANAMHYLFSLLCK